MDLQTFVAESLRQILAAVGQAQADAADGAAVNPLSISYKDGGDRFVPSDCHSSQPVNFVQVIEFDIATTVTVEKGKKATIGVVWAAVGLGAQLTSEASQAAVSRICFSVPVALPVPQPGRPAQQ